MDWPHAPVHRFTHAGAYMVTGATYLKQHHLTTYGRLNAFRDLLLQRASEAGASLHAWAVFSNHYHVVIVPAHAGDLRQLFSHLHSDSARALNDADGQRGRKVWFQFWDTALTYEKSYLVRLNYVHSNAVHHRLVANAADYRWCSAAWFLETAPRAFLKTVLALRTDRVNVLDAYAPELPHEMGSG